MPCKIDQKNPPLKGEASDSEQGDVPQILPYSPFLKLPSRNLRNNMTPAEVLLWSKIRRKQILGIQFLRQKPVQKFVLDFYAKSIKLAIEIDGGQHYTMENELKDRNRDVCLAEIGICTLRFSNEEVLRELRGVLRKIKGVVLKLTSPCSLSLASPFKGG